MKRQQETIQRSDRTQPQAWATIKVAQYAFAIYHVGSALDRSNQAMIALCNRWGDPLRFLRLAAMIAPQSEFPTAALIGIEPPEWQHFWYPHQEFDTALDWQRPYLEISLAAIEQVLQRLTEHLPIEAITLFGFAEGACLALEYAARNAYPFNAVLALSGVLLGSSLDTSDRFNLASSKTKVLLTASTAQTAGMRVRYTQTAQLLKHNGYKVIALSYERRPTTILREELEMSRSIMLGAVNET